jgi:hypothetical protein
MLDNEISNVSYPMDFLIEEKLREIGTQYNISSDRLKDDLFQSWALIKAIVQNELDKIQNSIVHISDSNLNRPGFTVKVDNVFGPQHSRSLILIEDQLHKNTLAMSFLKNLFDENLDMKEKNPYDYTFMIDQTNKFIANSIDKKHATDVITKCVADIKSDAEAFMDVVLSHQIEAIESLYRRFFQGVEFYIAYKTVQRIDSNAIHWIFGGRVDLSLTELDRGKKIKKVDMKFSDRHDTVFLSTKRMQASILLTMTPFALTEPSVLNAIDDGEPLVPVLQKVLNGINKETLNTFLLNRESGETYLPSKLLKKNKYRGFLEFEDYQYLYDSDCESTVSNCLAIGVPYKLLPNSANPKVHNLKKIQTWEALRHKMRLQNSILKMFCWPIHLPSEVAPSKEFTDAFSYLIRDLIIGKYKTIAENYRGKNSLYLFDNHPGDTFDRLFEIDKKNGTIFTEESLTFYFHNTMKKAIIGERLNKSLIEAVNIWHRKVATLEAVRAERRLSKMLEAGFKGDLGWPALCKPWVSNDGLYKIIPLTSAEELVEEGNIMDHCVGGYYEGCRKGPGQILSLQSIDGTRIATVQVACNFVVQEKENKISLSIQVPQFKGFHNLHLENPDHHDVLREFLSDVRSGKHAVDVAKLYKFSQLEKPDLNIYNEQPYDPADSESLYAYYKTLLPPNAPDTYDEWWRQSGLEQMFNHVLKEKYMVDKIKPVETTQPKISMSM